MDKELREQLAAIEHERWADWQKWCHKVLRDNLNLNGLNVELENVLLRWDKQIATPYKDLSEREKQSDREQVDRYWPIIEALITKEKNKLLNELIEEANTYIIAINQSDDYEVTERATPIDSIKRRIEE